MGGQQMGGGSAVLWSDLHGFCQRHGIAISKCVQRWNWTSPFSVLPPPPSMRGAKPSSCPATGLMDEVLIWETIRGSGDQGVTEAGGDL